MVRRSRYHESGTTLPHPGDQHYMNSFVGAVLAGAPEQLIDIPSLLRYPDPQTLLYVCGLTGFVDVMIDTAKQLEQF
jgi:hypothetical protein